MKHFFKKFAMKEGDHNALRSRKVVRSLKVSIVTSRILKELKSLSFIDNNLMTKSNGA